jgi:hypothetical protein
MLTDSEMTCNKNIDIKFSANNAFFRIIFIRYTQSRKVGKPNNLKGFGSMSTKGPKQDRQNQLIFTSLLTEEYTSKISLN